MADTLVINEIFHSIQGESSFAGLPCVFVRLTACNLRCTWCDTTYSFHEGAPMKLGDVIVKVLEYNCPLVEITGGEPLLQPNVFPLMQRLCDLGKMVLLETSGSVDVSRVDPRVVKIMDLKCPGSGEVGKNLYDNILHLDKKDEVKFVIADRADFDWAKQMMGEYQLANVCAVLFSPVWGKLPLKTLAEWILADRLPVRMQTQWHKQIWFRNPGSVNIMSLRIIIKSAQIGDWINERHGRPARRRDTDDELAVLFDADKTDYETLSIDEFIEVMKANHQVLLVDQEAGKTFHKFVQHG